jgi:hypothetical protein
VSRFTHRRRFPFEERSPELDAVVTDIDPGVACLDELTGRDHRGMAEDCDQVALTALSSRRPRVGSDDYCLQLPRCQSFLDSPLERNGFEISVPRCLATANSMGAFIFGG